MLPANAGLTVIVPFRGEEKSFRHLKVIGQVGQIVPTRIDIQKINKKNKIIIKKGLQGK